MAPSDGFHAHNSLLRRTMGVRSRNRRHCSQVHEASRGVRWFDSGEISFGSGKWRARFEFLNCCNLDYTKMSQQSILQFGGSTRRTQLLELLMTVNSSPVSIAISNFIAIKTRISSWRDDSCSSSAARACYSTTYLPPCWSLAWRSHGWNSRRKKMDKQLPRATPHPALLHSSLGIQRVEKLNSQRILYSSLEI